MVRGIPALKFFQIQLLTASYLLVRSPFVSLQDLAKMPPKKPRWIYTEDAMAEAIVDITDNKLSVRRAAQKWGIPVSTISSRMKGQTAKSDQMQPGQHLSKNQEANLVSWILRQESLGYAPSHSQIRACVMALLK